MYTLLRYLRHRKTPRRKHSQHHDENGIIWPVSVAPYHVIITVVNMKDGEQVKLGEKIYSKLSNTGLEVLLDDRDERAGVKFKDADIIGIPIRITVGKRAVENIVEYKLRKEADKIEMSVEKAIESAKKYIEENK